MSNALLINHVFDIHTKVADGAARFDRRFGSTEWTKKIAPVIDELDISDPFHCPLFYVFGSFTGGWKQLDRCDPFANGYACDEEDNSVYREAWDLQISIRP
jgi:hypothetical protein